jgi:hypothetical protein
MIESRALPGRPRCEMLCVSNSDHLSQIYTGFEMLHRAGEILLSQQYRKQSLFDAAQPQHLRHARRAHLLVIINGNVKLYYDSHDSFEIDEGVACDVDCYFKRSYAQSKIPDCFKSRVFPLGLNYPVYPASFDSFEKQRLSFFGRQLSEAVERQFRPTVENMHADPNSLLARGVLFMTRAWDPFDHPDRSEEKIAERICINKTRARSIQLLRREFGDSFLGGFLHTEYAAKNYADVLLPDKEVARKENYIKLLALYPVCVATTGLHGSTGWKIGEYVAFSRAIVSQRLNYEVPEDFKQGKNYLGFDEPNQCINAVRELLSNAGLRYEMMKTNHEYYLNTLKPDAMIRRTLKIALEQGK